MLSNKCMFYNTCKLVDPTSKTCTEDNGGIHGDKIYCGQCRVRLELLEEKQKPKSFKTFLSTSFIIIITIITIGILIR